MSKFRAFRDVSDAEIEALLTADVQREPARMPYYLNVSLSHPGYFALWYMRHEKARKEVCC